KADAESSWSSAERLLARFVVPAIGYKMPAPLEAALARSDVQDATQVLRDYARRDVTMSAACIGTFVMAESGLLNGHTATTTWWLAPLFRRRYPEVALEDSSMIVSSGPFVTAGGAWGVPVFFSLLVYKG